jgi:hypothetical protein
MKILSSEKKVEKRAKQCGKILVDFVNTESPNAAYWKLKQGIRNEINIRVPGPGTGNKPLADRGVKKVEEARHKLIDLFSELVEKPDITEIDIITDYLIIYQDDCKSLIEISADGSINPGLEIDTIAGVEELVAFCVVTFLQVRTVKGLLGRCIECSKFYFAKKMGSHNFCASKCRMKYHNRKRIESGEAAEYKRKKREEGAKESYYG